MSSLIRWEPLEELTSLQNEMRRMFERNPVRPWWPPEGMNLDMAMDVYEKQDNTIVKIALPGVKPEDVQVSVLGNALTITGEVKGEDDVEEKNYIRRERRYGKFSRTVSLPGQLPADKIQAEYENGVLILTIPKAEEAKSKRIQVKAK